MGGQMEYEHSEAAHNACEVKVDQSWVGMSDSSACHYTLYALWKMDMNAYQYQLLTCKVEQQRVGVRDCPDLPCDLEREQNT